MDIYQHDSATEFRFKLAGNLAGPWVMELEHAWRTAASVLKNRELVVDASGLAEADQAGIELLERMQAAGARLNSPPSRGVWPRA